MSKLIVKTATEADFFKRGRALARLADEGKRLPEQFVVSFEDPEDLLKLLTAARQALLRVVKENPGSITEIATRLHRDRSAVKRDVDELARYGLLKIEPKKLPGHGQMKHVSATAQRFQLEAQLA